MTYIQHSLIKYPVITSKEIRIGFQIHSLRPGLYIIATKGLYYIKGACNTDDKLCFIS